MDLDPRFENIDPDPVNLDPDPQPCLPPVYSAKHKKDSHANVVKTEILQKNFKEKVI